MTELRRATPDLYPSRGEPSRGPSHRLDPVVHGAWRPDAPISLAQARTFETEGFLALDALFAPDEVALLQSSAAGLLADPGALPSDVVVREPGSDEVRSIFDVHLHSALMARLAADARIVDIARFLLGDEVYVHQSRLNYKPGFDGKEFYWHSDFETWHVEDGMPRMRALSVLILLAENTEHNGPLMVMPGSHRLYLACGGATPDDHYLSSLKKQEYGVPDRLSLAELASRQGIVSIIGRPGLVALFDCNLMHGSNGNITPQPRSNAFLVYNAVSNRPERPFGAARARPDFLAARSAEPIEPARGRLTAGAAEP